MKVANRRRDVIESRGLPEGAGGGPLRLRTATGRVAIRQLPHAPRNRVATTCGVSLSRASGHHSERSLGGASHPSQAT